MSATAARMRGEDRWEEMVAPKRVEHPQLQRLRNMIQANYGVVLVRSWEERRAMEKIVELFQSPRRGDGEGVRAVIRRWSCVEGLVPHRPDAEPDFETTDSETALSSLLWDEQPGKGGVSRRGPRRYPEQERHLFIFRDLHHALAGHGADGRVRLLREVIRRFRGSRNMVVLLSPWMDLPKDLEKQIPIVDFPLPDAEVLEKLVEQCRNGISRSPDYKVQWSDELRDALVRACCGLTEDEAGDALATAVIEAGGITWAAVPSVLKTKQEAIQRVGCLEAMDAAGWKDRVGGLDALMEHVRSRKIGFTERGRARRLDPPKGLLALGVPGGGKSVAARAIADEFGLPLLRLDPGAVMGGLVGESEGNIREALKIAEAFGQCVLFVDEIGESLSGSRGEGDGGTTSRVISTLLTWMSERTSAVYVYFTANAIEKVPPALLRQGRIDQQFFVELPDLASRRQILDIHLRKRGCEPGTGDYDLDALARACEGYVGAEIEEAVISGLYEAANADRDPRTEDFLRAIRSTVPIAVTQREYIEGLLHEVDRGKFKRASRGESFRITDEWVSSILSSRHA